MPGELIGLAAVVLFLAIPIVAILANHQQKMAKAIHGGNSGQWAALAGEVERLRAQVAQLQETVNANVLEREMSSVPPRLEERLGE